MQNMPKQALTDDDKFYIEYYAYHIPSTMHELYCAK